jgi:heavy metal translocating P-type ATPase
MKTDIIRKPLSEYVLISLIVVTLAIGHFFPSLWQPLLVTAVIGSIPPLAGALQALRRARMTIDTFNLFSLIVCFATGSAVSAGFIALMLSLARLLEWFTESRAHKAIEELLKLKPTRAAVEESGVLYERPVSEVREGDILLIKNGERVPVDGVIVFGEAHINEAPVTGESLPVRKVVGDEVLGLSFTESGVIKVRATRVGKASTIERMVALIEEATKHKSRSEKFADRFAGFFLPAMFALGALTYLLTRDIVMVAALFIVACADDMAVAIPLAVTATLRRAAQMGVVIKGGRWLDALADIRTVIFDKTGTLTSGSLAVRDVRIEPGVDPARFWRAVAVAEKFSEHPIGRAVFRAALEKSPEPPDAREYRVIKGVGVAARLDGDEILIGNEKILEERTLAEAGDIGRRLERLRAESGWTVFVVILNGAFAGHIAVADAPRPEAAGSVADLHDLGIKRVVMFTGDNEAVAAKVAGAIGIKEFRASMSPEDKMRQLEILRRSGRVAMVGDGINDAPALALADVGIAMGGGGTAVAVEAADVVILTDNLDRLPELIRLVRRTKRVVWGDMVIWSVSNLVGFALVLTGIAGPALAAFYNFATDFLPLLNSAQLFRGRKRRVP